MKRTGIHALLLILLVFAGCKDESESPNMSVERYVELLKAGKYEHWQLPNFSSNDIPKLLNFRNEKQIIEGFPVNTLSSSLTPECTLGVYVLWTIESIRARSIGSKFLMGTFPSQNPVVKDRQSLEFVEQTDLIQQKIADSYFDWWESNKSKDFSEFNQIDPLEKTKFRWH